MLCLSDILQNKARSRSKLGSRLSVGIAGSVSVMAGVILWGCVSLDKVKSASLYGVLAIYVAMMITSIVYASITCANTLKSESGLALCRSWHKRAYKLVSGLTIVEHCVFFTAAPIILYHGLGLSMTECFSMRSCDGMNYSTWVTVSQRSDRLRTQELRSEPVRANLDSGNMAVFGGLLGSLGFALMSISLYIYGESSRRGASKTGFSLFRRRIRLVRFMGLASLTQLVFAIIGMTVVGNNWFVASLILSVISVYPIIVLHKGLSKDPTITRFQFRRIVQTSIFLIFVWLYCSGTGVSASLVSGIDLTGEQIFSLAGGSAAAQLILLLVFHLIFSALSATAIYTHLTITDVIESLQRTITKPEVPPTASVCATDIHTPQPSTPVMTWESRLCASCSTNQPNCVLVPCGHSVICSDCSRALLTIPGFRCPLCCVEVIDSQNIGNQASL